MPRVKVWLAAVLLAGVLVAPSLLEAQERPPRPEREREQVWRLRAEQGRRGWLGIGYTEVEGGRQIVLNRVSPESPAARAGLQAGDTIVRWNGETEVGEAIRRARLEPGETVRVRVRRRGERDRDLAVVVGERPGFVWSPGERSIEILRAGPRGEPLVIVNGDTVFRLDLDSLAMHADTLHRRLQMMLRDSLGPRLRELQRDMPRIRIEMEGPDERGAPMGPRGFAFGLEGTRAVAGAEFTEVNAGLADYFGTDRGVLVLRVAPETPAARAGLRAGDVVVTVDGQAVGRVGDLRRAVAGARDQEVRMEVVRKGQRRELRMRWE